MMMCLNKGTTRSSDVIAGLELALAQAEAMIERLNREREIFRARAKDVIGWCDSNLPPEESLYCTTKLKQIIAMTE